MSESRDLRETPTYKEIEAFYRTVRAPGENRITDGADLSVHPRSDRAAMTGEMLVSLDAPPVTRICEVDLLSGALSVRAPGSRGSDRLPKWSPDGSTLAFVSDRDQPGCFQLFLSRGEEAPVAAPSIDGIVESIDWSRDGRQIVLGVAGFGADIAGREGGHTLPSDPAAVRDWRPTVDTGNPVTAWRSVHVFDCASGKMRKVSPDGLNFWEVIWVGPGLLAAVVSNSHLESSWYLARLVLMDAGTGDVRNLFVPKEQIGFPVASPSGLQVALIEAVTSDRLNLAGELTLVDVETGKTRVLATRGVDVTHALWRTETTIGYIGQRGIETVAGEVDLRSGEAREIWASFDRSVGIWYPAFALVPDGGYLVVAEGFSIAPEVTHLRHDETQVLCSLASPASTAEEFNSSRIEPFRWQGRDGLELEGWLLRPSAPAPWPLVMDIHGGPVWMCRNRWQGRQRGAKVLADHGIASFFPNPRGSGGRGAAFAALVRGDMGGEDTHDYLTAIDKLVAAGLADPQRLGVTGISYGGFMSAWLVTQDKRFAAAAPISPVTNWYTQHGTSQVAFFDEVYLDGRPHAADGLYFQRSPIMHVENVRTPTLQLVGALDQNAPPSQSLEFHRALLEKAQTSVLVSYPYAGHGIRAFPEVVDVATRYVSWFLEYLGVRSDGPGPTIRTP